MGQIVIDIPKRANRRYILDDPRQAELLISALELSAKRVKQTKTSPQEMEDLADGRAADKAIAEMKRTGKMYKWEDVKADLGL